jgi:hypothetical protein
MQSWTNDLYHFRHLLWEILDFSYQYFESKDACSCQGHCSQEDGDTNTRNKFILWPKQTRSVKQVRRHYRKEFWVDSSPKPSIYAWYKQFCETGCLCQRKSCGRSSVSEDTVESLCPCFVTSPQTSTGCTGLQLNLPLKAAWNVSGWNVADFNKCGLQFGLKDEFDMVNQRSGPEGHWTRHPRPMYCHVSGVPWWIITGSVLDVWIYWHFC